MPYNVKGLPHLFSRGKPFDFNNLSELVIYITVFILLHTLERKIHLPLAQNLQINLVLTLPTF